MMMAFNSQLGSSVLFFFNIYISPAQVWLSNSVFYTSCLPVFFWVSIIEAESESVRHWMGLWWSRALDDSESELNLISLRCRIANISLFCLMERHIASMHPEEHHTLPNLWVLKLLPVHWHWRERWRNTEGIPAFLKEDAFLLPILLILSARGCVSQHPSLVSNHHCCNIIFSSAIRWLPEYLRNESKCSPALLLLSLFRGCAGMP